MSNMKKLLENIYARNKTEKRSEIKFNARTKKRSLDTKILDSIIENKDTIEKLVFTIDELCNILNESSYKDLKNKQYSIQKDIKTAKYDNIHISRTLDKTSNNEYFKIKID